MHEPLRQRLLESWARLVTRRPAATLAIFALLSIVSIAFTAMRLEFQADRSLLVDADLEWNARYLDYKRTFPRWDDLLIVITDRQIAEALERGETPEGELSEAVEPFTQRLTAKLTGEPTIGVVQHGHSNEPRYARLALSGPEAQYASLRAGVERAALPLRAASLSQMLQEIAGADAALAPESIASGLSELAGLLARIADAVEHPQTSILESGPEFVPLYSESGRLRLVQVSPRAEDNAISAIAPAVETIRRHIAETLEEDPAFAELAVGLTGIGAIEADETALSIADSTLASVIGAVLIVVLIVGALRRWKAPLLAMLSLAMGIALTFGYLTLVVGHLQLLSIVFTVILLGLGIDFALHLIAGLEIRKHRHDDVVAAFEETFVMVGPGMLTGAVTTAAAFAITALTDFRGVAEMGIISGGGVLICLITVVSTFPAMIALSRKWDEVVVAPETPDEHEFAGGALHFTEHHPRTTLAICLAAVVAAIFGGLRVTYDPNILNLQPPEIESVRFEHLLIADSRSSAWAALSTADDLETARQRTLAFLELPETAAVGGAGLLFHPQREQRREALRALLPESIDSAAPGSLDEAREALAQLGASLRLLTLTEHAAATSASESAALLQEMLVHPDAGETWAQLERLYARDRALLVDRFNILLSESTPSVDDLPPTVRERAVGTDGSLLLRIQPADAASGAHLLDPERLSGFVEAVRHVDAEVFGPPVQILESSRLIVAAYTQACILAVAVVFILLVLDFRSIADALCAMLPVVLGFVGMFGVLGVGGLPLNFANIIVLPLIFGIGVDAGVHMVHRWRLHETGVPRGLSDGTGRGITLTMLTTIIGFASMMVAHHRGIFGLGLTMTAGLFCTLLACYTALPAVLALRSAAGVRGDRPR